MPVGARTVLTRVAAILEDAGTSRCRICCDRPCALVVEEVRALEARVAAIDRELARVARDASGRAPPATDSRRRASSPPRRWSEPSSHIHAFRRGRDFASWLGSRRANRRPAAAAISGGISKRGDRYLRCLLTHGARAVSLAAQRTARDHAAASDAAAAVGRHPRGRRGHNKAAIAVANKLARIIWAVWRRETRLSFASGADRGRVREGVTYPTRCSARIDDHGVTGRTGTEPGR